MAITHGPLARSNRSQPSVCKAFVLSAQVQLLTVALRDAARWLQSAGYTLGLQSLKDAAARAESTLAEVSDG
jgi:hypothetical protein